jgi:hypothetical protein
MAERQIPSSALCGDGVAQTSNPRPSNIDLYNDSMSSLSSTHSNFLGCAMLGGRDGNCDPRIGRKSVEGLRSTLNDSEWIESEPWRIKDRPFLPQSCRTNWKTKIGDSSVFDNAGNAVDRAYIKRPGCPIRLSGRPATVVTSISGPSLHPFSSRSTQIHRYLSSPSPLYIRAIRIDG